MCNACLERICLDHSNHPQTLDIFKTSVSKQWTAIRARSLQSISPKKPWPFNALALKQNHNHKQPRLLQQQEISFGIIKTPTYWFSSLPALGGECTFPGAWAPGRAQKNEISLTRWHFSKNLVEFCQPWLHSIFCYRIFLDLSLSESQSTWS